MKKNKPAITAVRMMGDCLVDVEVNGCSSRNGKVRVGIDLGDEILFVTTDRISAFDAVLEQSPIPGKGKVLNQLSKFWFDRTKKIVPNSMVSTDMDEISKRIELGGHREVLTGRSMLMKKRKPLAIECIARGYIAGGGWKEYQRSGKVCGIELPKGMLEAGELTEPIFTPSTKAETGHDENITFERACEIVGREIAIKARTNTLAIYNFAREFARECGIIIADTKLEYGLDGNGGLFLIDEILTPDSSRFWPFDEYLPGKSQPSFDKQFVRDYLEALEWNKQPPAPPLPPDVIASTTQRYLKALSLLTGKGLN